MAAPIRAVRAYRPASRSAAMAVMGPAAPRRSIWPLASPPQSRRTSTPPAPAAPAETDCPAATAATALDAQPSFYRQASPSGPPDSGDIRPPTAAPAVAAP